MGLTILTPSDPGYNEGKKSATKSQAIFKICGSFNQIQCPVIDIFPTNFLHDLIYLHFVHMAFVLSNM